MSVCRGGMRDPGVHYEYVKKSCALCCALGARVRLEHVVSGCVRVCRLSDLVVSPGLLSLSGDLTTRAVAYSSGLRV